PTGFSFSNGNDLVESAPANSASDTPLTRSRALPCCGPGPLIFAVVELGDSRVSPLLAQRFAAAWTGLEGAGVAPLEAVRNRFLTSASPASSPPSKRPAMRVSERRCL